MSQIAISTRLLPILIVLFAILGCSSVDMDTTEALQNTEIAPLNVVTTISPITSIVENIGGDRINLQGIIPEGVNSHIFQPAPSISQLMSKADLIILNGLFLEEPSLNLAETNKKPSAVILSLGEKVITRDEWVFDFSFPKSNEKPNPHLWTDPILGIKYAELIRNELVNLDPTNTSYYNDNYEKLKTKIEDLDKRIAAAIQTIPKDKRKLLTYHDSFPFFGSRYGMEIIGAIQPSDFKEPSAREVANLINQVKNMDIPAIFGSAVFPSPVMKQIAKEGNTQFIAQLRDDDLPGLPGDPHHTYLGLMLNNVQVIVPALGGNTEALDGFNPNLVFEGTSKARYPR